MKQFGTVSIVAFLLSSAAVADDKESRNERDPWNGFPKGSWLIISESISRGGVSETIVERQEQTGAAGKIELSVHKEGKTKGKFDGDHSTAWHVPGFEPAKDKDGKLVETSNKEMTIDNRKYPCTVKKYELKNKDREAVVTVWHCKDASIPYRELGVELASIAMTPDVLRVDLTYKSEKHTENASVQVVTFKAERKIGNRTIVCVKEDGEVHAIEGGKKLSGKVVRWLSNEVPGREVAIVAEGEFDGKKYKKNAEVLDFFVAKDKK